MRNWLLSCAILLAVTLALRLGLAKKLGPTLRYAIWLPVLIRLLLPVGIGAAGWSVANWGLETEPTQSTSILQTEPQAAPALSGADIAFTPNHITGETTPGTPGFLPTLWVVGAILVGGWFLYVELRLALRLRKSRERVETESFLPVYVTDVIPSPCLFGLVRPAIYLTPEVVDDEEKLHHVLAHEETHFRHGDLIWSFLRGVCLAVHWFNPLVWWAAIVSRRDSETACDAGAIRRLGEGQRAAYGRTLLAMTCSPGPKFFFHTATLTGSRPEIKERIMLIASRPKTTLAAVLAVALLGGAAVGCTYPGAESSANTLPEIIVTDTVTQEKLPSQVIDYAKETITQRMADYEASWAEIAPDCTMTQARLTGLTELATGTARENDGLAAYRLEFRLQVSGNIDAVLVGGIDQETVDGQENWIGEYTSAGQPYLVFHWKSQSGSTAWEPLGVFWDDDVSQTVTQEQAAQYGDRFTAYVMEIYGNQMQ